jgi:hypothetical protein
VVAAEAEIEAQQDAAPVAARGWARRARAWAARRLGAANRHESALAYTLFAVAYLSDFSLLTAVFPVAAFVYALVAPRPARAFWQAALVYSEALIIASYAYQVPARLGCRLVSPETAQA